MNGINDCTFIGNVTKDIEVRNTQNSQVANFTLAINKSWKDKNGDKQNKTEFVNFVAWSPLSGILEKWVKKGDPLFVKGELQTRSYDNKEGNKRYVSEINVKELVMLGGQPKRDSRTESGAPNIMMEDDSDLPF